MVSAMWGAQCAERLRRSICSLLRLCIGSPLLHLCNLPGIVRNREGRCFARARRGVGQRSQSRALLANEQPSTRSPQLTTRTIAAAVRGAPGVELRARVQLVSCLRQAAVAL